MCSLIYFHFARYFENDHLTDMLPDLLVDSFERFVKNATDESDRLRKQVLQLEAEQHAAKQVRNVFTVKWTI